MKGEGRGSNIGGDLNGHRIIGGGRGDGGGDRENGNGNGGGNGQPPEDNDREATFGFPIMFNIGVGIRMNNIPPSILQTFCGSITEDINSFLSKLDILCCNYAYKTDPQKL